MSGRITAYVGLGSNLGDRHRSIRDALDQLDQDASIRVCRVSDLKETAPLGPSPQGHYLNGVARIETTLPPEELLSRLKAVEEALGRRRQGKWAPRSIDLDLLLWGRQVVRSADLTVPHPQMHLRSFVLEGLCQLAPELVHPLLGEPMAVLADRLNGGHFALDPNVPQLVSIAGNIGVGKTTLAKKLGAALDARVLFEPYDTNPYLREVYAGKTKLALDCQLYFLVHRAGQLGREALSPNRLVLTDYVFEKELIYARRLLNARQRELYERIYRPFAARVVPPVVVIYLCDSPGRCLERIGRRNRPYEQDIGMDFLEALQGEYERLFAAWTTCPVIRVSAATLSNDAAAGVDHLVTQVKAYVTMGQEVAVSQ